MSQMTTDRDLYLIALRYAKNMMVEAELYMRICISKSPERDMVSAYMNKHIAGAQELIDKEEARQ